MKGKILSSEEYKNLCIKYNLSKNAAAITAPVAPAKLVVPVVAATPPTPTPPAPGPMTRNRCGRCSRS